jgi:uncharacterized protein YndB with AHSA1/START domain
MHYEAPAERVFEFATDFKRYPEWNVSYIEVKEVTGPVDKVGTKVHSVMKVLGRPMEGCGEIVEVERPGLLKMSGSGPEGSSTLIYRFTPEGTGTKAEFEFEYELKPGIFGQITDKLFVQRTIERDLKHSMENSKAFIEAKVPVPA